MMIRNLIPASLVLILLVSGGCGKKEGAHREEHQEEEGVVHLSEESQKMVGLQLITAQKEPLHTTIEVVGEIAPETEHVVHITSPEDGLLKSYLARLGDDVDEGTPLCEIQTKTGDVITLRAASHGIVLAQYLKISDRVDPLTSIMTIADPDVLRASFNVYEKDLAGIEMGQKVVVQSIAYPDKSFDGEIVFISPRVDADTRTVKVRVDIKNEEHLLRFGMFVTGEIIIPLSDEAVTIWEEAVQKVGDQTVVFVPKPDEDDEFMVRKIKIGRKTGSTTEDKVEVISGLEAGEKIVGKGSFYLKSELLKGELEEGHAH